MSDPKYKFIGDCSVHGQVITDGYSTTAPPMCPIDGLQPYTNATPYQIRPRTHYPISYTNTISSTSLTYEAVGHICWPGSDNIGFIDSVIMTAFATVGSTGSMKLVDITNNTTIIEYTSIYGSTTAIYDLGVPSNLTATMAVWEIQMKCTLLGKVNLNSLTLK